MIVISTYFPQAMSVSLFIGGKKIKTMGSDLGEGLKGFKKAIKDDDSPKDSESKSDDQ